MTPQAPYFRTIRLCQATDNIVVAELARPERLNAMTMEMFAEIEQLAWAVNDDGTRVLVLTGSGNAFCAGYDLDHADDLPSLSALGMLQRQEVAARGLAALRGIRIPVIAAVNGAAAGGGLSLALAADIRLGSPAARFNCAFVRIGLSAGDLGASWLLTRIIGPGLAAEVAFTGRFIEADEAERVGLLNRVVAPDQLVDEAVAMAELICSNSPGGIQLSKRALQANMEIGSFAAALELENRGQALLTRGDDLPEALQAFRERRSPRFSGA